MKTQKLFRPGQNVTWGDRDETMRFVAEDEGPGPFKILTVEDIPKDECSCGGSLDDETHQTYAGCPYSDMGYGPGRKSVGHPQLVTLDDGTGKPLSTFSGAYFKAA